MIDYDILLEKLAKLEHQQWEEWSRTIAKQENISPDRLARWISCWKPYEDLSPEMQEHDRKWARKVLIIFEQFPMKITVEAIKKKNYKRRQ